MSSSQGERLRAVIESDILSMKLRPGDRLDEAKLAERYGTSRTPVREALRNLSAQGLVEIRPHKGAFVAKFGLRDLIELLEVLAELEGACGRFAAKSCLPADLTEIFTALRLCEKHAAANDTERYKNSNEAFHDAIYRASHNGHLIMLTRGMRKRVALYRNIQLDNMSRKRRTGCCNCMFLMLARNSGNSLPPFQPSNGMLIIMVMDLGMRLRPRSK
jgi:DNA-binding GntR family transcriptional regulator